MGDRPPLTYSPTHSNVLNCAAMGLSRVAPDAGGFMPTAGDRSPKQVPRRQAPSRRNRKQYRYGNDSHTNRHQHRRIRRSAPSPVLRTPRHGVHVLLDVLRCGQPHLSPFVGAQAGAATVPAIIRVHRLGGRPSDSRRARRHVRGWLRRARPSCVPGVRLAARRGDHAHHRPVLCHPAYGDHVIRDDGGAIPALPHWMGRLDDAAGVLAGVLRRGFPAGPSIPRNCRPCWDGSWGRCCWRSSQCCS